MIDFGRITDALGGLLSDRVSTALPLDQIQDMISQSGLDPAALQGLAPDELLATLAEHGIDLSNLAPEQLQQLLDSVGSVSEMAQSTDLGAMAGRFLGLNGR